MDAREVVTIRGVRLVIDPTVMSPPVMKALRDGWYEQEEVATLDDVIQAGDRVLELGGGIGFVSSYIALSRKAAAIVTIEANPELIPLITRVHELNEVTVTVLNEVALPQAGTVPFHLHTDFWASNTDPKDGARSYMITGRSISDYCKAFRPTVLIVDVEGGEKCLFDTADLSGVRTIVLETHEWAIGVDGVAHVLDEIQKKGFDAVSPSDHIHVFSRQPS